MRPVHRFEPLLLAAFLGACAGPSSPGSRPMAPAAPGPPPSVAAPPSGVEAAFARVRDDPARLYPFLRAMPKGGDLHSHLSGAVYAESFLAWADEDGLCVERAMLTLAAPPCDADAGRPTAAAARTDAGLRSALIDAFSTRNYRPEVENGHERFFSTFDRFGAVTNGREGDMLAETQARAASGNVRYLELMNTIGGLPPLFFSVPWNDDLDAMRQGLLDGGLAAHVEDVRRTLDATEARRDAVLGCDGPSPDAGCAVEVRWLYQVLRAFPRHAVFSMILTGFELADRDDRVVGFNLVQPEDDRVAMEDYSLHMRIIGHLGRLYPDVRVTLHAGELWEGLVPPEGLRFHIREAVEVAGARRIGHGIDVLHEDDPYGLLRRMARDRVMVEINLTSNDVILGVSGAEHPLATYLEYGVPVALSTDDEGVSRSEMTLEYVRAVQDQGVDYATLRAMARNSLEYAFVEGASVWADAATWTPVAACSTEAGGWAGMPCLRWTEVSPKARLQRDLEMELAAFEAGGWPR